VTENVDRARVFGERGGAVERIAPGFFPPPFEAEHVARYKWASRWVRDRLVVDVACGTGYGASILRAGGARRVLSLDVSRDALRFGLSRYGLLAACSDAYQLPLGAATCEAVVSLETIEHLDDPATFARELWRVLRPQGELLLSTPNAARSRGSNPYHLQEMNIYDLRGLLKETGFRVEKTWGQHWGLHPGAWHKVKGIRRILYEIERMAAVRAWFPGGLKPIYWCLRATKV
jgi:2-polyprenyl-3-methyl-5-hydroxy-6-metoxy-1,4-benzoquinol methylase